jgi:peptidoglycan hydrolase-like protein with peptidoglycan-binding domain
MRFIKPRRKINRVFIHCSASDSPRYDNVATMDRWHKQRGWSGVGYHFFIRKSGQIERGRDINKTPAAQAGNNRATIAICLHGLAKSKFTQKQFDALNDLCHQINAIYGNSVTFHGHREVAAKACPVFDYKKVLALSGSGKLGSARLKNPPVQKPDTDFMVEAPETTSTILRLDAKGWAVKHLQQQLAELGYHVGRIDGQFGKRTRAAVLAFQADNNLITDGIVGPATNEAFADARPREIGETRKAATLASLANDGSRIADASIKGGGAGVAVSSLGLLSVAGQFSQTFTELKTQVEPVAEPFGGLTTIMLIGLLCVVAFMTWQFIRTGKARRQDHQTGKTS